MKKSVVFFPSKASFCSRAKFVFHIASALAIQRITWFNEGVWDPLEQFVLYFLSLSHSRVRNKTLRNYQTHDRRLVKVQNRMSSGHLLVLHLAAFARPMLGQVMHLK